MTINPLLVLLTGGIAAAALGLVGITLLWRDTAVIDRLRPDERATLENAMLMKGFKLCENCGRRWTKESICEMCERVRVLQAELAPPEAPPQRVRSWEPQHQPEHPKRPLNFGRSLAPLYTVWPSLYEKGDDDET